MNSAKVRQGTKLSFGVYCRVPETTLMLASFRRPGEIFRKKLASASCHTMRVIARIEAGSYRIRTAPSAKVLEHVLAFLQVRDLKNCRLVSKLWKSITVPIFRALHEPIDLSQAALYNFNSDMGPSSAFPFSRFCMDLEPRRPLIYIDLVTFFLRYGPVVRELRIQHEVSKPGLQDQIGYFKILACALNNVPNLETLTLLGIPRSLLTGIGSVEFRNLELPKVTRLSMLARLPLNWHFIEKFFRLFPNTESLSLLGFSKGQEDEPVVFSLTLLKRLKKLYILVDMPDTFWIKFRILTDVYGYKFPPGFGVGSAQIPSCRNIKGCPMVVPGLSQPKALTSSEPKSVGLAQKPKAAGLKPPKVSKSNRRKKKSKASQPASKEASTDSVPAQEGFKSMQRNPKKILESRSRAPICEDNTLDEVILQRLPKDSYIRHKLKVEGLKGMQLMPKAALAVEALTKPETLHNTAAPSLDNTKVKVVPKSKEPPQAPFIQKKVDGVAEQATIKVLPTKSPVFQFRLSHSREPMDRKALVARGRFIRTFWNLSIIANPSPFRDFRYLEEVHLNLLEVQSAGTKSSGFELYRCRDRLYMLPRLRAEFVFIPLDLSKVESVPDLEKHVAENGELANGFSSRRTIGSISEKAVFLLLPKMPRFIHFVVASRHVNIYESLRVKGGIPSVSVRPAQLSSRPFWEVPVSSERSNYATRDLGRPKFWSLNSSIP